MHLYRQKKKSKFTVDKSAIFKTVALTIAAIATAVSAQPGATMYPAIGALNVVKEVQLLHSNAVAINALNVIKDVQP